MTRQKPHIFLKSICSVITITVLGSYIFLRGVKEKKDFNKLIGQVSYLDKNYEELPIRHIGKFRYLQVDNYHRVFEIFIGKDFGDFKPSFEQIDLLRLGDKIEIYYDVSEKETDGRLNCLVQYIDKDSTPYYIRGNIDKILGIVIVSFGLISILTLLILKQKDKIE